MLFYMHREENLLTFHFKSRPASGRAKRKPRQLLRVNFKPIFPGTVRLDELRRNGQILEVTPEERANLIRWPISFELGAEPVTITLRLAKFFTAVSPFRELHPGERSRGWVILDQGFDGETVAIDIEGEPATEARLEFVNWGYELKGINGGELIQRDEERGVISFQFPEVANSTADFQRGDCENQKSTFSQRRYARQVIEIMLQ
jgi:hypothetical protein